MKLFSKVKLLAIEEKVSAKGNAYKTVLVADGTETMTLMFKGIQELTGLQMYADYRIEIDYNTKYKSMSITKFDKVEVK
jgi:hypothetical protein